MNRINKKILGFWLYILNDCIMFASLFISILLSKNFYFSNKIYNYRIVLIESIILLICSYLTVKSIKFKKIKYYILIFFYSLFFLLLEFKDYYHLKCINANFNYNNFLSNYFFILGFHAFHVIVSIILCSNIIFLKLLNKKIKIISIIFSLFWHFIHIIWILIIMIVYFIK